MSPRVFKLGLALFCVMSGLFGAKLYMLGAKGPRASWFGSGGETVAPPTRSPAADAHASSGNAARPASEDTAAREAKEAESAAHADPPMSEAEKALVAAIKLELKTRGYSVGDSPAALDLQARAAIIAFEADHSLRLTGEASEPLLHQLLLGSSGSDLKSGRPAARAEEVIRNVQVALRRVGHGDVAIDGQMTAQTAEAIRAFERDQGMKVTGRVSGDLVARLQHVARDRTAR